MSDSNDLMQDDDLETQIQALQKRSRLLLILLGVSLLTAIGALGHGVTSAGSTAAELTMLRETLHKVDSGKEKAIEGIVENDRPLGVIHPLGSFVVNLVDPSNVRYVNCRIEVEVEDSDILSELNAREAQLKDAVISLLGSRTYQELAGLEGKTRLREELTARFNRLLREGQIARIYFTEFVIQ
jgi:flagellar FliL protein